MFEFKTIGNKDIGFRLLEARKRFERLFLFVVNTKQIIFRPLTISECESIYSLSNYIEDYILDEWVVSQCILSDNIDYLLNDAPAGAINSLANAIIKHSTISGIDEVASLLEREREEKNSTAGMLDSMVKVGAGHMLQNTKDITYKQQIKYVAFSEEVLGKKLELVKSSSLPKGKSVKNMTPETAAILSKENADKPDFTKDNAALRNL